MKGNLIGLGPDRAPRNVTQVHALSNYLLTHRKKIGYTQKQVAEVLKCSEHQIYRYERGHRLPDLKTALKLELLYRKPVRKLFRGLHEELAKQLGKKLPQGVVLPEDTAKTRKRGRRVLGIDPWTRAIGYAVLEGDELLDCGVRRLRWMTLPRRLPVKGKQIVEDLIAFYKPHKIALTKTDYAASRRSRHVRSFCRLLKKMAAERKLRVIEFTPNQVKARLRPGEKLNKRGICLAVADRVPELASRVPPPRKPWESQDLRTSAFQAAALAIVANGRPI